MHWVKIIDFLDTRRTFKPEAMSMDRIFLGIDSPYEKMDESIQFLENLPISTEYLEKIYVTIRET